MKPVKVAYSEAREDALSVGDYLLGCSDVLTSVDSEEIRESYAWIEDRATYALRFSWCIFWICVVCIGLKVLCMLWV